MRKHRKSATKLLLASIVLTAGMSLSTFAMTAEEVTAKTPTSYTAGTNSIYGPKLTQEQLNEVAQATADFMTANITDGMDTDQKIKAAYDYIKNRTTYVNWDAVTGANTAYTLVTRQGACSGMCRSMKALCDAMGIECYHVHSTQTDHQWNLVRFGDGILYHVDIDANKSAGQDVIYKSLTHPLPFDTSAYPAVGQAQEQTQANGMRVWMEGANIGIGSHQEGLPLYKRESRLGVSDIVVLDAGANMVEFLHELGGNIEPTGHTVYIAGFIETANGQLFALTKDGEPISYPFEYNQPFNLDFTGTHKSAQSLSDYCIQNNVLIRIWVEDDTQTDSTITWQGQYYAYATENSVKTGEIGQ